MLFFGILTCSKKPPAHITDRVKANADPKVEFFCFSPCAIEPISNQVNGYRFCKETTDWKEASFPIPSILYDQCFYDTKEKRMKNKSIVNWLLAQPNLIFLNPGFSDKLTVYQTLQAAQNPITLLPIQKISRAQDGLIQLYQTGGLILQPATDYSTSGQIYICYTKTDYIFQIQKKEKRMTKTISSEAKCVTFLTQLLTHKTYVAQPIWQFYTKKHIPFLLRFLLQKSGNGQWQIAAKAAILYPKSAWHESEQAEYYLSLHSFILQNFTRYDTKRMVQLSTFALQAASILDDLLKTFELLLDIGIYTHMQPCLLHWNHKPTPQIRNKIMAYREIPDPDFPIPYAKFLFERQANKT